MALRIYFLKVMDKDVNSQLDREETLQAMKEIRSQYGDNVMGVNRPAVLIASLSKSYPLGQRCFGQHPIGKLRSYTTGSEQKK